LKRYLKVYDLWKSGMNIQDIIKKNGTKSQKEHSEDPDIQRMFRRDIQKAKKIIANVEKGYFPG
jgi:hypothetical protein